jgi:sugar/nucleoside kinase (ribokinase family)
VWTDVHDYDGEARFHRPFLDVASHVFMNADRVDDPVAFARAQVARGTESVVCTLGADGALAVDSSGQVSRVAATPVAAVLDTNGAGDAFAAGFLAATLDGEAVPAALQAGAAQAASALGTRHLSPLLDGLAPPSPLGLP